MTKGRDLPPLLPLEYCRIDRAARMLGCEVEDIIHWGSVGSIDLCCFLEDVRFFLLPNKSTWEDSSHLLDQGGKVIDGQLDLSIPFTKYAFFNRESEGVNTLLGRAHGLWPLSIWSLKELEKNGVIDSDTIQFYAENTEGDHVFIEPAISSSEIKNSITFGDVWITKLNLEMLHKSIAEGESLPNIYNNPELARHAEEQNEATRRTRAPRTSHPQSEMIRALLLLHPDITEEQLATPHKLHGVLTEIFKATDGKSIMPDVHPNTFERWLKATTNS